MQRCDRTAFGIEGGVPGYQPGMRTMFTVWVLVIAFGVVYFSVVGLSHQ